ncbi:MAG: 4'-phosphopantetheinyl transferase superfamily protein [Candidatus Firestonebacteria bacterium]
MQLIGIGIDIFEAKRIRKVLKERTRASFVRRVYHPHELLRLKNSGFRAYALSFCIKEAFLKALGMGWNEYTKFHEVEVLFKEKAITFKVYGKTAALVKKLRIKEKPADYSDCGSYIMAAVGLYR